MRELKTHAGLWVKWEKVGGKVCEKKELSLPPVTMAGLGVDVVLLPVATSYQCQGTGWSTGFIPGILVRRRMSWRCYLSSLYCSKIVLASLHQV